MSPSLRSSTHASYEKDTDMTLSLLKRSEAITEVQRARLETLYRISNRCAHPKEAVNASDVQALKTPGIGIATASCRREGFSVLTYRPILPNVRGASSEVSIPRIAAHARLVPNKSHKWLSSRARPLALDTSGTWTSHILCNRLITNQLKFWRRGESNPRPKSATTRSLHA